MRAETEFSLLEAAPQPPLQSAPFHSWSFDDGSLWTAFYRRPDGYLVRFPDLADFEIRGGGREVVCIPAPGTTEADLQHLYLNQVLPLVLNALGKSVFHASAVEACSGAIAFSGTTGRGKSTLAVAFGRAGHRLLTDDCLVLEKESAAYVVAPSHPSVRLWEDSARALVPAGLEQGPALSFTEKFRYAAGGPIVYANAPGRLLATYFLAADDPAAGDVVIERLSGAEALREWTANSFLLDVQDQQGLREHFGRVADLATTAPCFRISYPRRFDALASVRAAIIDNTECLD